MEATLAGPCLESMDSWKSGIQTPMAQGRSTKIIPIIEWTRTSRLSIKISLWTPAAEPPD